MCEITQKLQTEGHAADLAEAKPEGRTSPTLDMLRDKNNGRNYKIFTINTKTHEELAQHLQWEYAMTPYK